MAIGNKLGLTDEDFDAIVAAASACTAAAAAGGASVDDACGAAAAVAVSDEWSQHDDKRERETLLRAQIEMDLQRTMPGYLPAA